MKYHYDTTRGRAYFGYGGKQSFADIPRSDGIHAAIEWLSHQIKNRAV